MPRLCHPYLPCPISASSSARPAPPRNSRLRRCRLPPPQILPAAARAPEALRPLPTPPPFSLLAGAVIPATLATAVDSDLPGSALAYVRQDVYDSLTGQHLLIPRGSRLFGTYQHDVAYGQSRLLINWTRLTLPNGRSYELDRMPSSDASGAAGLSDTIDRHLPRTFGAALLLSIISAGAQLSQPEASADARGPSTAEVAAGALGQQLNQLGTSLVQRELQIKPTLRIRPGTPFVVSVTADIVFSEQFRH